MKLSQLKRWKLKQKKFNQKYKLKSFKKPPELPDYTGKCLFLISGKNLCTILKFVSKHTCFTETALIVDDTFNKQVAKRALITSKRNRKLLENCEVMVTEEYKESVMKLVDLTKPSQPEATKEASPIKEFTCKICDEKFSSSTTLDRHNETMHQIESEDETENDQMTELEICEVIDDPDFVPIHPKIVIEEYNTVGCSLLITSMPNSFFSLSTAREVTYQTA